MVWRTPLWLAESVLAAPCLWPLRLVAVDGRAGSGKSHFAARLAAALGNAPIVPIDDFLSWPDLCDFWPRFERDVLGPLFAGQPARYQRRDWEGDRYGRSLGARKEVAFAPVMIVEGVGAARQALAERLTCSIWIETQSELCLERGVLRDGEHERQLWLDWQQREAAFLDADGARERAHLIIAGEAAPTQHAAEFHVLAARPPFA